MPKMQQHPTTNTRVPANGEHGMAQTDMQVMQSLVADGGASEFRDADACGDATVSGQGDAPHTEVNLQEEAKGTEVRYVRAPKDAVVNWPFMFSYKDGRCFVNTAPRKSAYAQATEAGEALF
jgi:hypothetical protein